jgi:hypothetical protein
LTEESGSRPERHLFYVSIVADIAMAAALRVHDPDYVVPDRWAGGNYGRLRDRWLKTNPGPTARETILGLASAGATALTRMPADRLRAVAGTYGFDLPDDLAAAVAKHFSERREEVLTYRR